MSSQLSSCTKPTWLASMKHGSHIMLQRFVRSMVSTRAAAVRDRAGAMVVQLLVVVRPDVAPGEDVFQVLEHRRVDRHHVFEVPVQRALLDHHDLAVSLDDVGLDLADLLGEQDLDTSCAPSRIDWRLRARRSDRANRFRAASRVSASVFCQRLQKGLVGPARREGRVLANAVGGRNTCQRPLAATAITFSTCLIGACIGNRLLG